jgi:ACS family pantothenate transporter-like MFS transporter
LRFARRSMWNNVVNAWWPIVLYPATDAPRFKKGAIAMLGTCGATLAVTYFVWYLERREKRRQQHDRELNDYDAPEKAGEVAKEVDGSTM